MAHGLVDRPVADLHAHIDTVSLIAKGSSTPNVKAMNGFQSLVWEVSHLALAENLYVLQATALGTLAIDLLTDETEWNPVELGLPLWKQADVADCPTTPANERERRG